MSSLEDIRERLTEIRPPGFGSDIVALGAVRRIDEDSGRVTIDLQPPPMPPQSLDATVADIRRAVGALEGVRAVDVRVTAAPSSTAGPAKPAGPFADLGPLPGVRDIIAVSSAKGGVGKSTVAANLAVAASRLGRRVGLMDADVYGPSLPILFGAAGRPSVGADKRIAPPRKYGIALMSMGFFLDESSPVIWRGPLVMGLVRQFLKDVDWGELDLLVVDLPPGTGDAQLTLVQQVPLAGAVVVTTPQAVATADVERGIAMFHQVNTPVLGVVENMGDYECPNCGAHDDVFDGGGGEQLALRFGVPFLGRIPLVAELRRSGDDGTPIVAAQPDHPVARLFVDIARRVLEEIEVRRVDVAAPTIIG